MSCPAYKGERECGFHSVDYGLSPETLRDLCQADGEAHRSCSEFIRFSNDQRYQHLVINGPREPAPSPIEQTAEQGSSQRSP